MRRFDPSLIRFDYVLMTKITSNSIFVVSDRAGAEYTLNQAPRASHNGRLVRKVRIHDRVSKGFFLYNNLREFSEPFLACLLVYDNEVLAIEQQRWNAKFGGLEDMATWKSYSERCMGRLLRNTEGKEVWINGTEVFWEALDGDGKPYTPVRMGKTGSFEIRFVDYCRLSRLGIASWKRQENKLLKSLANPVPNTVAATEEVQENPDDLIKAEDAEVLLVMQMGSVLKYTTKTGEFSYSPVLKNDLKAGSRMISEENLVRPLFNEVKAYRPNLHFVRKAGAVIGDLYGMEAVEILNIPSIIEQTGEVCLFNISDDDATNICLDMTVETAFAWLLGFLGRETRLNHMHVLNRLFRSLFKVGYTSSTSLEKMEQVIESAKAKGALPLAKYNPAEAYTPAYSEMSAVHKIAV